MRDPLHDSPTVVEQGPLARAIDVSPGGAPAVILALQRSAGNAAVGRLLQRCSGAAGCRCGCETEEEFDRVAIVHGTRVVARRGTLPGMSAAQSVLRPAPGPRAGGLVAPGGPIGGGSGGGVRYVNEPPQTLGDLDARLAALDADADTLWEAERPIATLEGGGTVPDFIVDKGSATTRAATPGSGVWSTIRYRVRVFDVLGALEHDVSRVNTEEQLDKVYSSYFPDSLVIELPVGMGATPIYTALDRSFTEGIIYSPRKFDPGGTARWAVLASAAKQRAREVQAMRAWELMRVIATSPVELIAEDERKAGACQQKPVSRKGGNAAHNAFADRVTGTTTDFWVKTPEGIEANFDGQDAVDPKLVWEVKTRHEWASEAGLSGGSIFSPLIHRERIYKLEEERARFSAVTRRCGLVLKFAFDDEELAKFLKRHWGNDPEVRYVP